MASLKTRAPFSVSGFPPLPLSLAPNADFSFTLTFTPTALGFSTGTLLLDATSVALSGNGTQPPPLQSYTITGPRGTAPPNSQSLVSITLSSPFPVAITGGLNMGVTATLPPDPSAQFSTGGRTVPFTIPANQTQAVFGLQGTQIGLQTGTVASAITVVPTFATQTGAVDVTPAPPTSLQFSVAPAAPTVIAVQIANLAATSLSIEVTGFATTRTLKSMTVQFGLAPGFSMPVTQFTFNIQPVSTVWFGSAASQAFGGQFTINVPFGFTGIGTGQTLFNSIASVSVSLTNEVGTSSSVQATLQ